MTRTQVQQLRLVAGFGVQPFVAAAVGFISFPLIDHTNRLLYGGSSSDPARAAIAVALAAFIAGFVAALIAIPVAAWRMAKGPLTLRHTLAWGAALGNLPGAFVITMAILTGNYNFNGWWELVWQFRGLAVGALFGMTGAAAFWLIAIRGTQHESTLPTLGGLR